MDHHCHYQIFIFFVILIIMTIIIVIAITYSCHYHGPVRSSPIYYNSVGDMSHLACSWLERPFGFFAPQVWPLGLGFWTWGLSPCSWGALGSLFWRSVGRVCCVCVFSGVLAASDRPPGAILERARSYVGAQHR